MNKKECMNKVDGFKKITESYITSNGDLVCEYKIKCKGEKCVGGFWGDNSSDVMIIAESPSGNGGFFGKYFGEKDLDKTQKALSDFIKDKFGSVAFFTDVVKCGIGKLVGKEKENLLNERFDKCKLHLKNEIKYLNPKIIICIGENSYSKLKDNSEYLFENLFPKPSLFKIMHYSNKRWLNINIKDKKNIIWSIEMAMQEGEIINNKMKDITKLSYFEKLKISDGKK